ncbi:MAG: TRAP transporter permease [Thermodesulfobacteriota bacterium]
MTQDSDRSQPGRTWGARRFLIFAIALLMAIFHMYTAGVRLLPGLQQRTIHLAFSLALIFLIFPARTKSSGSGEGKASDEYRPLSVSDLFLVFLSCAIGVYVFVEYENLSFRIGMPNTPDTLCSLAAIVLVLEATRRVIGWSIVIISLVGMLYLAVGSHLPPVIAHTGFSFEQVVNFMFFSTDGILGPALAVSATVIVLFIIFGAFLQVSGAGPLFIDTGMAFFGKYRGGPAKAAVVGSGLFGMITGSQVANVAAVGVFTIPLMKKVGYKPEVAGAIEAVSSTGAMIMPPVMGAAAFIIPEFIGGSYLDVVRAAIIPALLFYAALYAVVELQAAKWHLQRLPASEIPGIGRLMRERGHMVLPILVLVHFLVIQASTASRAAFWATVACIGAGQLRKDTRVGIGKAVFGLEQGAKGCLIVAACCASAGLITGTIGMAGLGERFSDVLLTVAGGNTMLLLILTMLASLVLGLPLPPVTCYLILAVLAAPALVKAGIHPMAAHLFVFFFGTLGNISPPVAPTSFAAAGLAGSDPMRTTNLTFIFSLPVFLIPYVFVYGNEILLMGSAGMITLRVFTSFVAVISIAVAFQGYLLRDLGWQARSGFFLAGLILIYPTWISDIVGYALLALVLGFEVLASRSKSRAAESNNV